MYDLNIKITKYFGCNGMNGVFLFVQNVQFGVWVCSAALCKNLLQNAAKFITKCGVIT